MITGASFWIAAAVGALFILGSIGLILYMVFNRGEATQSLADVTHEKEEIEEKAQQEKLPESVFNIEGTSSVSTPKTPTIPPRRRRNVSSSNPVAPRDSSAPGVARMAAPRRPEYYEGLEEGGEGSVPPLPPRERPKTFTWDQE